MNSLNIAAADEQYLRDVVAEYSALVEEGAPLFATEDVRAIISTKFAEYDLYVCPENLNYFGGCFTRNIRFEGHAPISRQGYIDLCNANK